MVSRAWEEVGDGSDANRFVASLRDDDLVWWVESQYEMKRKFWRWVVAMVAQYCECTQCHGHLHLKVTKMEHLLRILYYKKGQKKKKELRLPHAQYCGLQTLRSPKDILAGVTGGNFLEWEIFGMGLEGQGEGGWEKSGRGCGEGVSRGRPGA